MEYTTPLILTKINIPQISDDLVERPRLIDQLNTGLNRKATIISAPAGYGKSTLAINWLRDQTKPIAWLSLSETENDLSQFLNYLVAAIKTIVPKSCQNTQDLIQASPQSSVDHIASTFINDITAIPAFPSGPSFILALDDYHAIDNQTIHQLMSQIIIHQPAQMHLVIISRLDPFQLPIGQLRAGRDVMEIRQTDLRFDLTETHSFFTQTLGLNLSQDIVELIDQQIEGWVVGLRLASLSLHSYDDQDEILRVLKGTDRYVMEYLLDEVLSRQPQAIQAFMLKISILDRLCGALCEAITGVDDPECDGQAYLEWLEKTNLFVIPLDNQQEWFRYHHLFQELLVSKLKAEYPDAEFKELHCRASHWFAENDYVEEAIQHALAADKVEHAIDIVEDNSQNLLNRWDRNTLERWLSMLPQILVWDRPKLLLVQAWMLFRQWRLITLHSVIERIELLLDIKADLITKKEHNFLSGQLQTLRSANAYLVNNDFPGALASGEEALRNLPVSAFGARSIALAFCAFSQQSLGQLDSAVDLLKDVIRDSAPSGPSKVQAFIGLSQVYFQAGDLYQMNKISDEFLILADRTNETNAIMGANYIAGFLNYEWDKLQTAETYFKKAVDLRYRGNFLAAFMSGLGLVRLFHVQGKLDQAKEVIDSFREDILRIDNTDLLPHLDAAQAEHWLYQRDTLEAKRWAQSFQSDVTADKIFKFELPILTQARILVYYGNKVEVQAIQRRLEDELGGLENHHFTYRTIQTLAHLALVYDRLELSDKAMKTLQLAIRLAQPGGLIRSFVDCGSRLAPLLKQLVGSNLDIDYLQLLVAAFETEKDARELSIISSIAPLTRREIEVLRLISDGLTNQEIANELYISLNTVKRHTSNIYRKFAVNNRREALTKSRKLNIIL